MIKNLKIENWFNGYDAAFSSTWDDMTITSIYDITDEANKRNIKTTIYINKQNKEWNTDLFYGNDFKKSTNLEFNQEIINRLKYIHNLGNEIGNHTYSHISLKKIKYDDYIHEITKCNNLISNITGQKEYTFCFPHGHVSNDIKIINSLKKNFISSRGADYGKNKLDNIKYINTSNINFNNLKTIHVGTYPYTKNTDELNFFINKTIEQSGWLIEYGHGWDNDGWCPVDKNMLLSHYDYIFMKKTIWCDTILNISKYIQQRQVIKINVDKNENEYILNFENVINNSPITISFECDKNVEINQNNKVIKCFKKFNKIYFNIYIYYICVIKIF